VNRTLGAEPQLTIIASGSGLLRQAGPDDATSIREFVCGLSTRSQYLRFFASVAPPSSGLLRALCGSGNADVLLLIGGDGAVIAHAMAADEPAGAGRASSIGLVVADAWQRQGIGTMLLDALMSRAARRGVDSLVFEVLPANRVMLGMIARRWPDARPERTPDAIVFRPAIAPRISAGRPVPAVVDLHPHRSLGDEHARPPHAA
jgi:ribosomal protein S18 acetylase RimI-like enzyme